MSENRFDRPTGLPRLAAFHGWRYPVAEELDSYLEVERIAEAAAAEVRFFHADFPDLAEMGSELRARAGRSGFFVPFRDQIHENDFHHFKRTRPDQTAALMVGLAKIANEGEGEVWQHPAVRASFSCARWAQGWGADLVVARGQYEPAVHALLTSVLLGVPMCLHLPWLADDSRFAVLLPAQVETADFIWTGSEQVERVLLERFGDSVRHKLVGPGAEGAVLVARVQDALSRSHDPGRLAFGPQAAFRPTGAPIAKPLETEPSEVGRAKPFVILGSERTGSNLLVGLLGQQPGIVCAGEMFNPRSIEEGTISWIENHEVHVDTDELVHLRGLSPDALCDRLLRDGAELGGDWAGFKLLYYHGLVDDRIVRFLADHPDIRVIHLRRRDRLARWLSFARAEAHDDWFTARRDNVEGGGPRSFELDPVETVADFEWQPMVEERFAAVFEGRPVLEIDYEDFAADLAGTALRLADFFGREFGEMVPRSRKTGAKSARDGIANYRELLASVRGTVWEPLVAELEVVEEIPVDGSSA
ncbi:MAG: sulfotransferase [Planctomycetota bacterium]|nr:sulfotransferase [Planctomycetota bacterium]